MINYTEAHEVPLCTDESIVERVSELIGVGLRRQLWLMFLDSHQRQLPLLMPHDVTDEPLSHEAGELGEFIREVAKAAASCEIIVTFERPGGENLSRADRHWFAVIGAAARIAGVTLRGPLLCHDDGVRWIAPEDCWV